MRIRDAVDASLDNGLNMIKVPVGQTKRAAGVAVKS